MLALREIDGFGAVAAGAATAGAVMVEAELLRAEAGAAAAMAVGEDVTALEAAGGAGCGRDGGVGHGWVSPGGTWVPKVLIWLGEVRWV